MKTLLSNKNKPEKLFSKFIYLGAEVSGNSYEQSEQLQSAEVNKLTTEAIATAPENIPIGDAVAELQSKQYLAKKIDKALTQISKGTLPTTGEETTSYITTNIIAPILKEKNISGPTATMLQKMLIATITEAIDQQRFITTPENLTYFPESPAFKSHLIKKLTDTSDSNAATEKIENLETLLETPNPNFEDAVTSLIAIAGDIYPFLQTFSQNPHTKDLFNQSFNTLIQSHPILRKNGDTKAISKVLSEWKTAAQSGNYNKSTKEILQATEDLSIIITRLAKFTERKDVKEALAKNPPNILNGKTISLAITDEINKTIKIDTIEDDEYWEYETINAKGEKEPIIPKSYKELDEYYSENIKAFKTSDKGTTKPVPAAIKIESNKEARNYLKDNLNKSTLLTNALKYLKDLSDEDNNAYIALNNTISAINAVYDELQTGHESAYKNLTDRAKKAKASVTDNFSTQKTERTKIKTAANKVIKTITETQFTALEGSRPTMPAAPAINDKDAQTQKNKAAKTFQPGGDYYLQDDFSKLSHKFGLPAASGDINAFKNHTNTLDAFGSLPVNSDIGNAVENKADALTKYVDTLTRLNQQNPSIINLKDKELVKEVENIFISLHTEAAKIAFLEGSYKAPAPKSPFDKDFFTSLKYADFDFETHDALYEKSYNALTSKAFDNSLATIKKGGGLIAKLNDIGGFIDKSHQTYLLNEDGSGNGPSLYAAKKKEFTTLASTVGTQVRNMISLEAETTFTNDQISTIKKLNKFITADADKIPLVSATIDITTNLDNSQTLNSAEPTGEELADEDRANEEGDEELMKKIIGTNKRTPQEITTNKESIDKEVIKLENLVNALTTLENIKQSAEISFKRAVKKDSYQQKNQFDSDLKNITEYVDAALLIHAINPNLNFINTNDPNVFVEGISIFQEIKGILNNITDDKGKKKLTNKEFLENGILQRLFSEEELATKITAVQTKLVTKKTEQITINKEFNALPKPKNKPKEKETEPVSKFPKETAQIAEAMHLLGDILEGMSGNKASDEAYINGAIFKDRAKKIKAIGTSLKASNIETEKFSFKEIGKEILKDLNKIDDPNNKDKSLKKLNKDNSDYKKFMEEDKEFFLDASEKIDKSRDTDITRFNINKTLFTKQITNLAQVIENFDEEDANHKALLSNLEKTIKELEAGSIKTGEALEDATQLLVTTAKGFINDKNTLTGAIEALYVAKKGAKKVQGNPDENKEETGEETVLTNEQVAAKEQKQKIDAILEKNEELVASLKEIKDTLKADNAIHSTDLATPREAINELIQAHEDNINNSNILAALPSLTELKKMREAFDSPYVSRVASAIENMEIRFITNTKAVKLAAKSDNAIAAAENPQNPTYTEADKKVTTAETEVNQNKKKLDIAHAAQDAVGGLSEHISIGIKNEGNRQDALNQIKAIQSLLEDKQTPKAITATLPSTKDLTEIKTIFNQTDITVINENLETIRGKQTNDIKAKENTAEFLRYINSDNLESDKSSALKNIKAIKELWSDKNAHSDLVMKLPSIADLTKIETILENKQLASDASTQIKAIFTQNHVDKINIYIDKTYVSKQKSLSNLTNSLDQRHVESQENFDKETKKAKEVIKSVEAKAALKKEETKPSPSSPNATPGERLTSKNSANDPEIQSAVNAFVEAAEEYKQNRKAKPTKIRRESRLNANIAAKKLLAVVADKAPDLITNNHITEDILEGRILQIKKGQADTFDFNTVEFGPYAVTKPTDNFAKEMATIHDKKSEIRLRLDDSSIWYKEKLSRKDQKKVITGFNDLYGYTEKVLREVIASETSTPADVSNIKRELDEIKKMRDEFEKNKISEKRAEKLAKKDPSQYLADGKKDSAEAFATDSNIMNLQAAKVTVQDFYKAYPKLSTTSNITAGDLKTHDGFKQSYQSLTKVFQATEDNYINWQELGSGVLGQDVNGKVAHQVLLENTFEQMKIQDAYNSDEPKITGADLPSINKSWDDLLGSDDNTNALSEVTSAAVGAALIESLKQYHTKVVAYDNSFSVVKTHISGQITAMIAKIAPVKKEIEATEGLINPTIVESMVAVNSAAINIDNASTAYQENLAGDLATLDVKEPLLISQRKTIQASTILTSGAKKILLNKINETLQIITKTRTIAENLPSYEIERIQQGLTALKNLSGSASDMTNELIKIIGSNDELYVYLTGDKLLTNKDKNLTAQRTRKSKNGPIPITKIAKIIQNKIGLTGRNADGIIGKGTMNVLKKSTKFGLTKDVTTSQENAKKNTSEKTNDTKQIIKYAQEKIDINLPILIPGTPQTTIKVNKYPEAILLANLERIVGPRVADISKIGAIKDNWKGSVLSENTRVFTEFLLTPEIKRLLSDKNLDGKPLIPLLEARIGQPAKYKNGKDRPTGTDWAAQTFQQFLMQELTTMKADTRYSTAGGYKDDGYIGVGTKSSISTYCRMLLNEKTKGQNQIKLKIYNYFSSVDENQDGINNLVQLTSDQPNNDQAPLAMN